MWMQMLWRGAYSLLKTLLPLILLVIIAGILFYSLVFTNVSEGSAKALMRRGAFIKFVMAWEGHTFNEDWDVVEGEETHLMGGFRFVGYRGLDTVYTYNFRWRDLHLEERQAKITFHQEKIDYILVRPDVYFTDIEEAETKPPERIPLNVHFLVTIKVVNPYKALFVAPPNWNENVMMRLNAIFRDWVGTKELDDILELREEPKKLCEELCDDPLIQMFEYEWGVKIEDNGIQIRDVGLPPGYQEPAARERVMQLEAKGRAAETVGTVIEMMATARGKTVEEIQEEIEKSNKRKKEFLDIAKDLIVRKMGIEGGAYADIRVEGAEGLERIILNALAIWQRMPGGKPPADKKSQSKVEEIKEAITKRKGR
jgi:hypothetical protein